MNPTPQKDNHKINILTQKSILIAILLCGILSLPFLSSASYVSIQTDLQHAPDFTLSDLDNNRVNMSDFQGSVTILLFWTTW